MMRQLREVLADLMAVDGLTNPQAVKERVVAARTNLRQVIQQMGLPTARVVGLGEGKEVKS
ncbi:hypothetical protein [Solidesulfovibrio sp.]|uniref:hypothetical protein n=1 Tax=Solidesulfovibrio sp. TaxID=2910990 RepID=UPI00260B389E|nr:hypothetical protein [Solidesulfovibrio sp.]